MAKKILVVDDKLELRTLLKSYLTQEGFDVVAAGDGQEALYVARHEKPNLIILDLMMPNMGGYEFMHAFSREADTPVVILTAKIDENDKVLGLELGADDYVTKPFSPRELVLRAEAVLRRGRAAAAETGPLSFGGGQVVLDEERHEVKVRQAVVGLTPTEWGILATLASVPGRVYSRYELINRIRGYEFEGYERTIDSHVKNLRRKIEEDPADPRIVETVLGVGYRLGLARDG